MIAARTIVLPSYQITGVSTALYTVPPLAWSPKRVAESGWFAVDFAGQLDDDDAIIAAAVTVVPDVPGGLSVLQRLAAGTLVLAMLSGGMAGTTYAVTVSASTADQSLHPATVQLQVTA